MGKTMWPEEFFAWRVGDGCPMCDRERDEEDDWGARFFAGEFSDAYLQRRPISPGYTVVIFRGRHVADLSDFADEEVAGYATEVRTVGRLVSDVFEPLHLNYQLLGNAVPHVHTHVVPRYLDDPAPGGPLPSSLFSDAPELPAAEFASQLARLREAARTRE